METTVFEEMYRGVPPWDIARAQSEVVRLVEAGEIRSPVLDVGCGTGENVLYLAERGYDVTGIDIVPAAIAKARKKAGERSLVAEFLVWDVLKLHELHKKNFNTAIDSGFFHTLTDEERPAFARELASVLALGGTYFMMSFSEHEPGTWGPRRVRREEIHDCFGPGWQINFIREMRFDTNFDFQCCKAWLASITLTDRDAALRIARGYGKPN